MAKAQIKHYLVTSEFIVGELGQMFTKVFIGKDEKAAWKEVEKYFKDYYGEDQLEPREKDSSYFEYKVGAAVKLHGIEEVVSLERVLRKLGAK